MGLASLRLDPPYELGQIDRVRFLSPRLSRKSGAVEHQRRQQRIGCDWSRPLRRVRGSRRRDLVTVMALVIGSGEPAAGELERVAGSHLVDASDPRTSPRRCSPSPRASRQVSPRSDCCPAPLLRCCWRTSRRCRRRLRSSPVRPKPAFTTTLAGGCWLITTCVAAAGVTVMALEVALLEAAAGDARACSRWRP